MLLSHARCRGVAAGAVLFALGLWLVSGARVAEGQAASAKAVREHVVLTLVKRTGSSGFRHAGRATGTVSGSVRSQITLTHSVVMRGTVTIKSGHSTLRLKVDGRARSIALRSKFTGSASIAGGSGRYAHASGAGSFTGVVNRSTWAVTIDASGSFRY